MAEVAYGDLETPGQVLNEDGPEHPTRCECNLVKKPIGRHWR